VATRETYDIGNGSGPELSCSSCEWCWGADNQPLVPINPVEVKARLRAEGVSPGWM